MGERGIDVHAVSSPGPELQSFGLEQGIKVHAITMLREINPVADLHAMVGLVLLLRKLNPDIVHAHTPKAGLLGMLAARINGVPVCIYHLHGLPFQTATGVRRRILLCSEWIACRLAHEVLCVSRSTLAAAEQAAVCRPGHGKVLLAGSINGVDALQQFNPESTAAGGEELRRRLGIPADAMVLGYVGRVVRDKGIVELFEAWARLRNCYPELYLLVVGTAEQKDAVPQRILDKLRGDDRVRMTGQVGDTAPCYATLDVFVLPSHREGFGLAALEASAMRVPVVATQICGIVDAVQDGITGLLVAAKDSDALTIAVTRYLDDDELRACHGHAGRARALDQFRPTAVWQALSSEYDRLLGAR